MIQRRIFFRRRVTESLMCQHMNQTDLFLRLCLFKHVAYFRNIEGIDGTYIVKPEILEYVAGQYYAFEQVSYLSE